MPGDLCDKKLLTIVVTDGEPTSNEGNKATTFKEISLKLTFPNTD